MLAGVEVTALRETAKALKAAGVADDAVKAEMGKIGGLVVREALRLAPVNTGKLAKTIKATGGKNKLDIVAGNNTTVKYAYTFHAIALGKSNGGFTFRVPIHQRNNRGRSKGKTPVQAHTAQRYIPNRPFLYQAWERNRDKVLEAYVAAVASLFKGTRNG